MLLLPTWLFILYCTSNGSAFDWLSGSSWQGVFFMLSIFHFSTISHSHDKFNRQLDHSLSIFVTVVFTPYLYFLFILFCQLLFFMFSAFISTRFIRAQRAPPRSHRLPGKICIFQLGTQSPKIVIKSKGFDQKALVHCNRCKRSYNRSSQ